MALLSSGFYSLFYGRSFAVRQQNVLNSIDTTEAGRVQRHLALYANVDTLTFTGKQDYMFSNDAYLSDYRMQKTVYNPISPFAALSIGQKDVFPYYFNVYILNNIYTSKLQEIRNPSVLLAGNFDLAFVIIYLFPLFIIAFGFSVLSSEKDTHTFSLLKIHAVSINAILFYKILFRFALLSVCIVLLSVCGFILNGGIALSWQLMLGWILTNFLYIGFWFALVYFIASLNLTSSFNAVILISFWILFLLFIPSAINYIISQKEDDPESLELISADRDGDNDIWKLPFRETIAQFHKVAPQFDSRAYPVKDSSETRFMAYMELSQIQKNKIGEKLDQKMNQSYQMALLFNPINPAFTALTSLNHIAAAEIPDQLAFTKAVKEYQRQRRHFIFSYKLSEKKFSREQFLQFPKFTFHPPSFSFIALLKVVTPLFLWILLLSSAAYLKTRKL